MNKLGMVFCISIIFFNKTIIGMEKEDDGVAQFGLALIRNHWTGYEKKGLDSIQIAKRQPGKVKARTAQGLTLGSFNAAGVGTVVTHIDKKGYALTFEEFIKLISDGKEVILETKNDNESNDTEALLEKVSHDVALDESKKRCCCRCSLY